MSYKNKRAPKSFLAKIRFYCFISSIKLYCQVNIAWPLLKRTVKENQCKSHLKTKKTTISKQEPGNYVKHRYSAYLKYIAHLSPSLFQYCDLEKEVKLAQLDKSEIIHPENIETGNNLCIDSYCYLSLAMQCK